MGYDFSDWTDGDLIYRIRYIDNAPSATTMSTACRDESHGYTRGGGVCRTCCLEELCRRWKADVRSLNGWQLSRYSDLRKKNTHNMAIMLACREGPAGTVKGSRFPCPKRRSK